MALILIGLLIVLGLFGNIYLLLRKEKQILPVSKTTPTPLPSETLVKEGTPTITPNANWKTYGLKTVGLEFKVPPIIASLGAYKEQNEVGSEEKGFQGSILCSSFSQYPDGNCYIGKFGFGVASPDFANGRGGAFTDCAGYVKKNGKYYCRWLTYESEIPSELAEEVINPFGLTILKVAGRSGSPEEPHGVLVPMNGEIGALINAKNNSAYTGLAVLMKLDNNLTESLFDQILSTFRFLQ